jgi:hypothetical protein
MTWLSNIIHMSLYNMTYLYIYNMIYRNMIYLYIYFETNIVLILINTIIHGHS